MKHQHILIIFINCVEILKTGNGQAGKQNIGQTGRRGNRQTGWFIEI